MKRWLAMLAVVLAVGSLAITGCSSKQIMDESVMASSGTTSDMDSANLGAASSGQGR